MYLADMTVLDGVSDAQGYAGDVELNFYKNAEDKLECFQFICRNGEDSNVVIPMSQLDNVLDMLQKIKDQQPKAA